MGVPPTCSSHLWRETSTHHAGSTRPRLHGNTYLDTLASLGRTKNATHADAIATKGGIMQKRKVYYRRATAPAFRERRRNETGPNTESQNRFSGAGSH